ncbi:MAG: sugar diacid recognition domain-containing protein, partial [Ruthenibacterium sp.]
MANRVFQGVIYQMKDAIDRMVGVVDETGTIISCTDLSRIGEVRDGVASERLAAGDSFVRDGFTYHLFTANKRNDYAVLVEGTDEAAGRYAALLA